MFMYVLRGKAAVAICFVAEKQSGSGIIFRKSFLWKLYLPLPPTPI